ncbi:MAG: class I SAM-dependent methyltransferase [Sphingobacteriales bacterium]|nr:MAG: class I SAM-dependent methyltransferase [Sphingobacteriales bacterium]
MQQVPLYKKILSMVYPVLVKTAEESDRVPLPQLYLYRGQYQVATHDALYSDGTRYRPLKIAYAKIEQKLPGVKNVLVLGTGLGSAVQILYNKGYQPEYTLVDYDKTTLKWAMELLPAVVAPKTTPVLNDAESFMQTHDKQYDLVVVDIFKGRRVPAFVMTTAFLQNCRRCMKPAATLVLNYMINNEAEWQGSLVAFKQAFPNHEVITTGINRLIIATV